MIDTIYATNDAGPVALPIPTGTSGVPFNQPATVVGSAILKLNDNTFMINETGTYRVEFTLQTAAASALGSAQVLVNGVPVGMTSTLISAGTSLSGSVVFDAATGNTIQLAVGGLGLSLAAGESASITIMQLESDV